MKTYPAVALLGLTALLFWASCAPEPSEPEVSQAIEEPIPTPTEVPDSGSGSDRTALIALYNATNGTNWLTNTGWLKDLPINEWHGVYIDAFGRVVRIDLEGNRLIGEIPPEIGDLTKLEALVLFDNSLTGQLPPKMGEISSPERTGTAEQSADGDNTSRVGQPEQP